uniref:Uncharacterized protein n=1 Tax=Panagrolaimus sp. JU765 TaxID=591449 RepID=A0AC34RHG2_9BILA
MPRLLFAELVCFQDGRYFPLAYMYREMNNFIIVTKRIGWMKVIDVAFFKIIDCSVLADFCGDFPSIDVLEQLLPLLLNLKHLTVQGTT